MSRLRNAPVQGTGLKDQAHHATVRLTQNSATKHTVNAEIGALRCIHIARISNGGKTYKRLDSAALLNAPPIAATDQRGGLNCKATNRHAIPKIHANKNAMTKRLVILRMSSVALSGF